MISNDKLLATLICWIGDTDLLVFAKKGKHKQNAAQFYECAKKVWQMDKEGSAAADDFDTQVGNLNLKTQNSSIILTLKDSRITFSKIILLTNRPSGDKNLQSEFSHQFKTFIHTEFPSLVGKVIIKFVPEEPSSDIGVNGWNYEAVYKATKYILKKEVVDGDNPNSYCYNITPGTIAQSTTLILIGKELSHDSRFIQVEKARNRVDICNIPFDISAVLATKLTSYERAASSGSGIIGKAPCFKKALDMAKKIAWAPVSVLLTGPSGTGKEVFAREIHRLSGRPEDKFIAVNCAMLSKETGLTELTGYFKGAYTGADKTTPGKFDKAKGGTLFLDEIGDCPTDVQAELLRFLQPLKGEKPTEREWLLKGNEPTNPTNEEKKYLGVQRGDIRVIAATNKKLLNQEKFRQDLYFRLETIQIELPSLEQRKSEADTANGIDDLRDLADFFLAQCNKAFTSSSYKKRKFNKDAYTALQSHTWTGNIRELQNAIMRLSLLSTEPTITREDVLNIINKEPDALASDTNDTLGAIAATLAQSDIATQDKSLDDRIEEFKRAYCSAALRATGGKKKEAYTTLKIAPKTFDKYIDTP